MHEIMYKQDLSDSIWKHGEGMKREVWSRFARGLNEDDMALEVKHIAFRHKPLVDEVLKRYHVEESQGKYIRKLVLTEEGSKVEVAPVPSTSKDDSGSVNSI